MTECVPYPSPATARPAPDGSARADPKGYVGLLPNTIALTLMPQPVSGRACTSVTFPARFFPCKRIKSGSCFGHPAQHRTYQPSSGRATVVTGRRVVVRDVGIIPKMSSP